MKNFTFFLVVLFYVNLVGGLHSSAQDSSISPDPMFNKGKSLDATLNEGIKAKEHDGANVFSYAEDAVLGNKLRKSFTVEIEKSGAYYLSAYVNTVYDVPDKPDPAMKDKKYPLQEISVYIDDEFLGNLDISKSGWCSSRLKPGKKSTYLPGNM